MSDFLERVRNERQFLALTGLSKEQFNELLNEFSSCIDVIKDEKYRNNRKTRLRRPGGGRKGGLVTPEQKLFFVLCFLKSYPTFDMLGFVFDMSPSKASENIKKLLPVLKMALKNLNVLPQRHLKDVAEFEQLVEKTKHLVIDATERPHFRHKKLSKQRQHYSGKKRRHTVKNTVISDCTKRVIFVGKTVPGSRHDYSVLKEELKPENDWFKSVKVSVDLGYQGIKSDYLSPENIHIPHKKPRKSKKNANPSLTQTQRRENKEMGRTRVVVEHAIGGMKAFNILASKFRNRLKNFVDDVFILVAGLWNLKTSFALQ
jgi:hypothetical protein